MGIQVTLHRVEEVTAKAEEYDTFATLTLYIDHDIIGSDRPERTEITLFTADYNYAAKLAEAISRVNIDTTVDAVEKLHAV